MIIAFHFLFFIFLLLSLLQRNCNDIVSVIVYLVVMHPSVTCETAHHTDHLVRVSCV